MKKALKIGCGGLLGLIVFVVIAAVVVLSWEDFGGEMDGERLERAKAYELYQDGAFQNPDPPPPQDLSVNLAEFLGDQVRKPPAPFPAMKPKFTDPPEAGLRATWFGHATVLIEIDGKRVLTDPMLSEHGFPVTFLAPTRHNDPPLPKEQLPKIDLVTISHDHFDHLDMATVKHLAGEGTHFFVGLGIGAHLEVWGVPAEQIHEMVWWQSKDFNGLKIHCTPAQHYSGRTGFTNATLWSSWVVEGPVHRVFHSGDSGYAPHFTEIGQKRGPIDVAFIKIGDYGNDAAWEHIHMVPEDSVKAFSDLGAKTLFPIHWGTIQLSYHPWDEPIERAVAAAKKANANLVTPKLGETYVHGQPFDSKPWWKSLGK